MTTVPDAAGHFGPYGGRFVPEALIAALTASLSVRAPASTGTTVVPSRPIRWTLGAWRRMSSEPM